MSKKLFFFLIATLLSVSVIAITYQYIHQYEKSSEGYVPTAEQLAYLDKKLQKKIKNPKRYDKPKEAMEYYVRQRAPFGQSSIPVEQYEIARQQMDNMPRINSSQNLPLPSVNEANLSDTLVASSNFSGWSSRC